MNYQFSWSRAREQMRFTDTGGEEFFSPYFDGQWNVLGVDTELGNLLVRGVLFLDEDGPLAQMLDHVNKIDDVQVDSYLTRLRAAFPGATAATTPDSAGPILDPLSGREIEVLRLLAAGLASPEIAQELTISVSTVRSHMKNIYSKLDVHSRYEAVVRAQELQLL